MADPSPRPRSRAAHAPKRAAPKRAAPKRGAEGGRAGARQSRSRTVQPPRKANPRPKQQRHHGHGTLRVIPTADAPHGRLGLAWAAVTFATMLAGPVAVAVWQAAHAGLAGAQAARSFKHRKKADRPDPLATAVASSLIPLGAAFGWRGAAAGAVACVMVASVMTKEGDAARGARTALALGAAAGSLVIARGLGVMPGLFLFGLVAAFDTGNYLVGTGARHAWEGPSAGLAAMIPVTVGAATIAVPPFTDTGPWILGAMAAVLTPAGPYAGSALLGSRTKQTRVPALRRLDALLLVGPAFAVAATFLKT